MFKPHPQVVAQAPFNAALKFTGDPEADMALAATTLSDAQLETAIMATEGGIVGRILVAELDRRMEEAVAPRLSEAHARLLAEEVAEAPALASADHGIEEWWMRPTPSAEAVSRKLGFFGGASAAPAQRLQVEDAGIYALPDGTVVKVQANKEKTKTYAKRWTPAKHLDRLMEAGAHEHGEYVYEPGLVDVVARTGRKLTLEEAKAHSIRYGQCVRCGRKLTDGKSVEQGMGPVCITYFS